MARAGVEGGQIGHVVFGHVINTEPRDMYLCRVAAMEAGIPGDDAGDERQPAVRLGPQAIVSAAQALALGDADFALAGGAESMSRSPYILPRRALGPADGRRRGARHDDRRAHRPFGTGHMGITAENVAERESASRRDDQDAFAAREPEPRGGGDRATAASPSQIVPVEVTVEARHGRVRHRRAPARRPPPRRSPSSSPAFRKDGTRHRRQRLGPQRRRRGGGAGHRRGCGGGRAEAAWRAPRLRPCRCRPRGDGHRPGPGGRRGCWSAPA